MATSTMATTRMTTLTPTMHTTKTKEGEKEIILKLFRYNDARACCQFVH